MPKCDKCSKEANFSITEVGQYCLDCYNQKIAEMLDKEVPHYPKEITLCDNEMNPHVFKVDFMFTPGGKMLNAYEDGDSRYKCEVFDKEGASYLQIWDKLMERLKKMMSIKYIAPDGRWYGTKVVGHIDYDRDEESCVVVIDGNPYSLEEIGNAISNYEGWQIKIEITDPSDDFE